MQEFLSKRDVARDAPLMRTILVFTTSVFAQFALSTELAEVLKSFLNISLAPYEALSYVVGIYLFVVVAVLSEVSVRLFPKGERSKTHALIVVAFLNMPLVFLLLTYHYYHPLPVNLVFGKFGEHNLLIGAIVGLVILLNSIATVYYDRRRSGAASHS